MSTPLQDFYKAILSQDWSIGTGNFYVSQKPTTTSGWLVISPSSDTLREIVKYTNTGTDSNGDYVVISERGCGDTSEQAHTQGEKIRLNITSLHWEEMRDDIDSIVAAGAPNASTTERGIVEIATDAEVIAGTDTGSTGAKLVATPGQIKANYEKIVPIVITYLNAVSPATWTKPAGLKYIEVEVQAAGGNGGNASSVGSSYYNGSGGGAGGYSKKNILASSLGATEIITIGSVGNSSSFGTHCSATSGSNGYNDNNSRGGAGGIGSGGNINVSGGAGSSSGSSSAQLPGSGGNSYFGAGGQPGSGGNGGNGGNYGGGGGGAQTKNNGSSTTGGVGGPAIVIVKEFY